MRSRHFFAFVCAAPGFRKNLVGLGYLTPPKGVDFQAAANYWLDAAGKYSTLRQATFLGENKEWIL